MLQIAIVEDDKKTALEIRGYIENYAADSGHRIEVSSFSDGDEIVENYKLEYDVILMDVQMQFMDGITAARHIRERDPDVIIIFITNMAQYAINGYEVNAFDYVLKPISYFAFAEKLDRAISRRQNKEKKYLAILSGSGLTKLDIAEIRYIESHGHTLTFHLREKTHATGNMTMKEAEEKLTAFDFYRCSKSYLVNLEYVVSVDKNLAYVGDDVITISRMKRKDFMDALTNYVGAKVN